MLRVNIILYFGIKLFDQHFRWRGEYSLLQKRSRQLSDWRHLSPRIFPRVAQPWYRLLNSRLRWQAEQAVQLPSKQRWPMEEYLRHVNSRGVSRWGAQSFFDCNAESYPPNGIHNYVNTRSELKCYDSVLYGFLKEIFPCQNKFLERCDARAGNSSSFFISYHLAEVVLFPHVWFMSAW